MKARVIWIVVIVVLMAGTAGCGGGDMGGGKMDSGGGDIPPATGTWMPAATEQVDQSPREEVVIVEIETFTEAPTLTEIPEPTDTFLPATETATEMATEWPTYDGWLEPRVLTTAEATAFCENWRSLLPLTPCPTMWP